MDTQGMEMLCTLSTSLSAKLQFLYRISQFPSIDRRPIRINNDVVARSIWNCQTKVDIT